MERILGLDYGRRRLGFALSDPTGSFAMPIKTVSCSSPRDARETVRAVCADKEATCLVVGLPLNMDGTHSEMTREVETFVEALRAELDIPVEVADERLSSAMADRAMLEADLSRAKRKASRDRLAAQIILQTYLDTREGTPVA